MKEQVARVQHLPHETEAAEILERLILSRDFIDFLTLPAYDHLP